MKNLLLLSCALFLAFSGCKQLDKLTQFEIDYDQTVVIPASTGINLPFDILTPDIETDSESAFAGNDTRKDMIEEIKLTSMTLTVDLPAGGDFGFLKTISIFISADGLAEAEIAWKELVPADAGPVLNLDVSDTDLKEYIKKDKFKLRVYTITDEFLSSDYHINVHSVFFVDAKVLGR